jgi:hypothetical protein
MIIYEIILFLVLLLWLEVIFIEMYPAVIPKLDSDTFAKLLYLYFAVTIDWTFIHNISYIIIIHFGIRLFIYLNIQKKIFNTNSYFYLNFKVSNC